MKLIFGFFFVLVLSMSLTQTISASAYSFVGVTSNGVEFPIEDLIIVSEGTGNSTGTGNGTATVNGMGINSRIIQEEYNGRLVVGVGVEGEDVSLTPYLPVDDTTEFVALVEDNDTEIIYQIPVLGEEYELQGNNLYKTNTPNLLIYSDSVTLVDEISIGVSDNHYTITGDGVTILEMDSSMEGVEMYLDGVSSGTLKIVTSNYDLIADSEILYEYSDLPYTENGYEVAELDCISDYMGADYFDYVFTIDSGSLIWTITTTKWTWNYDTTCDVDIEISSVSNVYNEMEMYVLQYTNITWCDDFSGGTCYYDEIDEIGEIRTVSTQSNDLPTQFSVELITNTDLDGKITLEKIIYNSISNGYGEGNNDISYYPYHSSTFDVSSLYDTGVFYDTEEEFVGEFNTNVIFPNEKFYLIISPNGGETSIRGTGIEDVGNSLRITNLPVNVAYQIEKDSEVIGTGVTSSAGVIDITSLNVEEGDETLGGYLHLFPDSLVYRGDFSTVILDNVNGESIHVDSEEDLVYVVHAYALIPTVGDVSVSGLFLSSDEGDYLPLDYLNKDYSDSESINVPVIPNYDTINFDVDDIEITLSYSSIIGGTGINIIEASSSTINNVDYSNRILFGEAIIGTTSYVIATTDGTVNAIVSETISGSVYIENTYYLLEPPPPPPEPRRRDPLDGWVDIYINGKFDEQVWLGTNDNPNFIPSATQSGYTAVTSVSYVYSDFLVSGAVSIDVESGDFVEFYMYAKIHGDIDNYSVPEGETLIGEEGTSSATVNILQGSIITSE